MSLDPLDQNVIAEIRATKLAGGQVVAEETRTISIRFYFHQELLLLLKTTGFVDIQAVGDYSQAPPSADSEMITYFARRP